jgi:nicotinamide-nucleotide amidase
MLHDNEKLHTIMIQLAKNTVTKLIKKKLKISCVESCTGGLLSSSITSISGSSKVFSLGLVTYSNETKINILRISKKIIAKHGAVSKECCLSMVKNLSKISKANILVSITGIAGPNGGTKLKPVGLVYIGVKKGNKIIIKKNLFKSKNRTSIQIATVRTSFNIINEII